MGAPGLPRRALLGAQPAAKPLSLRVELRFKLAYQLHVLPDDVLVARVLLFKLVELCTAKLILYTQGVEMGQDIIVLGT